MRCKTVLGTGAAVLAVGWALVGAPAVYASTTLVPYLNGIVIDGDKRDWGQQGFRVEMMAYRTLEGLGAEDFEPRYRLAWNEQGLLLLLEVRDNIPVEESIIENVWMKDSVRIALTPERGAGFVVHIAPGADPESPGTKIFFENGIKSLHPERTLSAKVASAAEPGAYRMEILLPWSNLESVPQEGTTLSFAMTVSDIDNRDEITWTAGWHADSSHQLRLAREASPPIMAYASGRYERLSAVRVTVRGVSSLVGQSVVLREGQKRLAKSRFEESFGRALAEFDLPMPSLGETWGSLTATIRGQAAMPILLADAREIRARKFSEARLTFDSYLLERGDFPRADYEDTSFVEPLMNAESIRTPSFVESLIGPYAIKTTFYDAEFNIVLKAEKPGRYGAMVEVIPAYGRTTRRFQTLFRLPAGLDLLTLWAGTRMDTMIHFPDALGIELAPGSKRLRAMDEHLLGAFASGFLERRDGAALLAGLYEGEMLEPAEKPDCDPMAEDRQWWVTFKRQLYGMDEQYPEAFVCPRPIVGTPAPVLHEGTLGEAGMKADAAERINAVLEEWAADSDEAFSVCVARHGVIVLHRAYGQRHGQAMTVDTSSWMASITKMMSAILMMMLVDQDLVDMDAPVADYLPPFRDIEVEKPITIRNLYTHTGGLWGHWGDDLHDMEEVVADYSTFLASDKMSFYNGAGNALGSKIVELVSGEALPLFYRRHLLEPLECKGTRVSGSMGDARSTPLDMARIGQMLLGGGAYGSHRFMREETVQRMLPARMTRQFGPNTTVVKGFGCQWFSEHGLSARTFGHGAASSATFRIDLDNDLVIVMCRNSAGQNFHKHYPRFIAAIVDSLAE